MTRVLGLGHSHSVAVAQGCYALQHEKFPVAAKPLTCRFVYLYAEEFMPTLMDDGDRRRLNPNLAALIERERPDFLVLCVGGNEHIAISIVQPKERIDFILGAEADLPLEPGATVLPEAAIRETLRDGMRDTLATIAAVREATPLPIMVIEPPPPLPNLRVLEYPKEFFHRVVDKQKLSLEIFRYKVWRLQSALYREICDKNDLVFVGTPAEFIEPPGVLAKNAWGGDASHANQLFGRRMMVRACEMVAPKLLGPK